MSDISEGDASGLVWLIIILAIVFVPDFSFIKGTITAYPVFCKSAIYNYETCEDINYTLYRTVYKVNTDRQEVIVWRPGLKGVDRYAQCAIQNRKNWNCSYDDKSGTFGFTDGKYFSTLQNYPLKKENIFYAGRLTWWFTKFFPTE